MDIGAGLKYFRRINKLTQKEMAAGVISESYYSRVERNQHEIDVNSLIKILRAHDINIVTFFNQIDKSFDDGTDEYFEFAQQCTEIFNDHDLEALKKLRNQLSDDRANDNKKVFADTCISFLTYSYDDSHPELEKKIKNRFMIDNWYTADYNELSRCIFMMDFDSVYHFVNMAYKSANSHKPLDAYTAAEVATVASNFIVRCYTDDVDPKYWKTSMDFLKSIPINALTFYARIAYVCNDALLHHDQKKLDRIADFFKEFGLYPFIRDSYEREKRRQAAKKNK